MALNFCDDNRSSCVSTCVINRVPRYYLVIVYLVCIYRRQYRRIRGRRGGLHRGRGGTLYHLYQLCQLYQPRQAILVQASKNTIAIYLFREPYQSQVFILQAFIYQSLFIVYLCLSLEIFSRASSSIQIVTMQLVATHLQISFMTSCQC